MAIFPLTSVVVHDPAEKVKQILGTPMPFDIEDRSTALNHLSLNVGCADKRELASYLTVMINQPYQNTRIIKLCYEVAEKAFSGLSAEARAFKAGDEDVGILSEYPIYHAVSLNKKELLLYHLGKEGLRLEDIRNPLTDYLCTHTAEDSAAILQAVYAKNPGLLNLFLKTQMELFAGYLMASKEPDQGSIDQFLSLIKFNKAYQAFYGQMESADLEFFSPQEAAKHVMQIAHKVPIKIITSLSCKLKEYPMTIKKVKAQRGQLLTLKTELEILLNRLEIAKQFLKDNSSFEEHIECLEPLKGNASQLFEISKEHKTDLSYVKGLIDFIDKELNIPKVSRKRRPSEELKQEELKAPRVQSFPPRSSWCTLL